MKTEPGTTAKVPGKNRFKNQETKRRQKAKWEEIKKIAKEERAQPAPAFEIPARGGDVPVRSFFDPISGRRETMEVKPIEREQKFRTAQSGFSRYPTETRTCYQCGEKGHLSANCPQKMRRVSLTEGVIKYEGGRGDPASSQASRKYGEYPSEFDDVRPEDSASQVGGQYLGTMSSVGDYEEVFAASATTSDERESKDCQEQTRCSAADFCNIRIHATTAKAPS